MSRCYELSHSLFSPAAPAQQTLFEILREGTEYFISREERRISIEQACNLVHRPFPIHERHYPSGVAGYLQAYRAAWNAVMAQNRNARLRHLQVLALNKIGARKVLWNNLWDLGRIRRSPDRLFSGFSRFSGRRQITNMVLKAPRGTLAAQIEIRRTICLGADDSEAGCIEKGRAFCLIKPEERLQRPGGAVVDPDTVVAKDPVDLTRQSSRFGKKVDQKRGHDAPDGAIGKGSIESIHRHQLDIGAGRSTLTPAKSDVTRLLNGARHGQIKAIAI